MVVRINPLDYSACSIVIERSAQMADVTLPPNWRDRALELAESTIGDHRAFIDGLEAYFDELKHTVKVAKVAQTS